MTPATTTAASPPPAFGAILHGKTGAGTAHPQDALAAQARLVDALARSDALAGGRAPATLLETHISYVLLTGTHAYKIKKAVNFGFLDFTTLERRRYFCEEELRLNRRLAPELYLDVVPITGTVEAPRVGGEEPALEYAVQMREFPQAALASRLLERGELAPTDIDALAERVARFHGAIELAGPASPYGDPEAILRLARRNFAEIGPQAPTDPDRDALESLRAWTEAEHAARRSTFVHRRQAGYVRECHGDLHLGNIARVDGAPVIFDCIEFNESMRWIDVMSEVAFTVMDLQDRARADLAYRFLNAYLERTGDYAGLSVLPFYLVYRALVRAKIARLRATQLCAGAAKEASLAESRGYLMLATSYTRPARPALIITCGLSGCGKTTLSQALLERIGAVRVRSDVERKRMHRIAALERCDADLALGMYADAATEATYARLRALARGIVEAGRTAIVDATFLRRSQRESFHALAVQLGVAFVIVAFDAMEATLRERVTLRRAGNRDASDADVAVLVRQIKTREALSPEESAFTVAYDAEAPVEAARAPAAWAEVVNRIARYPGSPAIATAGAAAVN